MTNEAQDRINEHRIKLRVITGTEIRLSEFTIPLLEAGRLLSYGNTITLLIESSSFEEMTTLREPLEMIISKGFQIIFAHPEKNRGVQRDTNVLLPFVESGVAMQITAANFIGMNGSLMEGVCEKLILNGMGQVIASDAHSARGNRAPYMKQACDKALELIRPKADILFTQFPGWILDGKKFPRFSPSRMSL